MRSYIDLLNEDQNQEGDIAKLNENESPFGPSQRAVQSIINNASQVSRYTDELEKTFQQAISQKDQISPELVIVSNGSDPLLKVFGQMVAQDGQGQLVVPDTTYESVIKESKKYGALISSVAMTRDLSIDLAALDQKANKQTTGIYICNPNNPTGNQVGPQELRDFIAEASRFTPCLIDEAYIQMSDNWERNTVIDMTEKFDNVMVTRTFSKIYGMAGQRIGYAAASSNLMYQMKKFLPGSGFTNSLGLHAALASLGDVEFLNNTRNKFKRARNLIYNMVKNLGLEVAANPQSGFIYFNTGMNAKEFYNQMTSFGVSVSNGESYTSKYPTWSRVSVGLDWEIRKFQDALQEVIQ